MAAMLDEHMDCGYFTIGFHQMADKHHDARVVRLIPLFVEEQYKIAGIISARQKHVGSEEPYLAPFKTSLNSFGLMYNPYSHADSLPICAIHENIKHLVYSSGVVPKTAVFVGSLGKSSYVDFVRQPPGSTDEENHTEYPPQCKCSKFEPPRFLGSTLLINYSQKNINIGVGQPTTRSASESGVDIPDRSLFVIPHNFQFWLKKNTSSENIDFFKIYLDRCMGYRKYVMNSQYIPEDEEDDDIEG